MFSAFTDPAFFAQARVGEGGRSLEWPELDFCADALRFRVLEKLEKGKIGHRAEMEWLNVKSYDAGNRR